MARKKNTGSNSKPIEQYKHKDNISPTGGGQGVELTADTSIARSGETLRQSNWRDELLRAGVRAKGGKLIEFTRVERRYKVFTGRSRNKSIPLWKIVRL